MPVPVGWWIMSVATLPEPRKKDPSNNRFNLKTHCMVMSPFKPNSLSSRKLSQASSSLDFIKPNRNTGCGCWSLRGHFVEKGYEETRYIRLGCKKWTCQKCGPKKVKRVRHAIKIRAVEFQLNRLLTLTLDPRNCSPEESIPYVRNCWNKFRTYLKRRYRGTVSYITVVELQKSGYAHLHILLDRFMEQSWIKEAWQAVGGGKIVDIRQIDLHRVAPYLSKYLTKDLLCGKPDQKYRRYTTSRDIRLFGKIKTGKWTLIKWSLEIILELLSGENWEKARDNEGNLEMVSQKLKNGVDFYGPVSFFMT